MTATAGASGGGHLEVRGEVPLRGRIRVPGDKSISHRALLLAALGEGTSAIEGCSRGDDVLRTLAAVRALGAAVDEGAGGSLVVHGGRSRLVEPPEPLDCGNSGTAMRLLLGVLAGLDGYACLWGDGSLRDRPMDRVVGPLAAMGARIDGRAGSSLAPLGVRGGALRGLEQTPPVASAQVKSAILLAGLSAVGDTVVHEPLRTRAHTEEMLAQAGAGIEVTDRGGSRTIRLSPGPLAPTATSVPGDPSQAAFWVVAACVVPGSSVEIEDVYVGTARAGYLEVLSRMGADVALEHRGASRADIRASYAPLVATDLGAAEVPGLVDEVPVLAVAAAVARGTSRWGGLSELRVKETDRLESTARMLRSFGGSAVASGDELVIEGGQLHPGAAGSDGDHRIAMAATVAALAAGGDSRIDGIDAAATSYPDFGGDLRRLAPEALGDRGAGS